MARRTITYSPHAVCTAAGQSNPPWEQILFNQKLKLISLRRSAFGIPCTINVYYSTGTVSISLQHPNMGIIQVFRVECAFKQLKQILFNPRRYGDPEYQYHMNIPTCFPVFLTQLPHKMEKEQLVLSKHVQALKLESENIAAHSNALNYHSNPPLFQRNDFIQEENSNRALGHQWNPFRCHFVTSNQSSVYSDLIYRGSKLSYFIDPRMHEFLENMDLSLVRCLSLLPNGKGYIYTRHDGFSCWNGVGPLDIPEDVDNLLRTRSGHHCRAESLALSQDGRYFLKFANGNMQWVSESNFTKAINCGNVKMVAFGQADHSFVVLYKDGKSAYCCIPSVLAKYLSGNSPYHSSPDFVSLGPKGEFFLRFKDGVSVFGGMGVRMFKAMKDIQGDLREVSFAFENSFTARYNPK